MLAARTEDADLDLAVDALHGAVFYRLLLSGGRSTTTSPTASRSTRSRASSPKSVVATYVAAPPTGQDESS